MALKREVAGCVATAVLPDRGGDTSRVPALLDAVVRWTVETSASRHVGKGNGIGERRQTTRAGDGRTGAARRVERGEEKGDSRTMVRAGRVAYHPR